MFATVPVPADEAEDDEEEDEDDEVVGGEDDDAAVPPQPAAATTVTVANSAADLPVSVLRCFLSLLTVTTCSFCWYSYLFLVLHVSISS
jgi:hypothetical protein